MKTLVNILIFVVLFLVSPAAFAQQRDMEIAGDWNITGVSSSEFDSILTTFYRSSNMGVFGAYGKTISLVGQNGFQVTFDREYPDSFSIPDSIFLIYQIENWIGKNKIVVFHLGLQGPEGYVYLKEKHISPNFDSWEKIYWDMNWAKECGMKTVNILYLAVQIISEDSSYVYVGIRVRIRDLGLLSGGKEKIVDFGTISTDVPTDVEDFPKQIPLDFVLSQNYPNPFNPTTTIRFSVPKQEQAKLAVYNVLGQEVKVLLDQQKGQGSYEVKFDASSLPSGTYFYRLQVGGSVETKKMLLVK